MTEKIALIGAGIMGSAIATRLLDCGHQLSVFDLDAGKVAALVQKGAKAATSPADAASKSDYIILSLNHARIVRAAVFGIDGVAESATGNRLLIDMSSIDPGETRDMAVSDATHIVVLA